MDISTCYVTCHILNKKASLSLLSYICEGPVNSVKVVWIRKACKNYISLFPLIKNK